MVVPLRLLGLQRGGQIAAVSSFSALGTFATGAIQVLDRVRLGR